MYCAYGCKQKGSFTLSNGKRCCSSSYTKCPFIRKKNSEGTKRAYQEGKRESGHERYKNMTDDAKQRMAWSKGSCNADFIYDGKGNHKGVLIRERGHTCEKCMLSEWNGSPIPLEMDHIDGDWKNNIRDNLQLLCPNCHAQTPTWKGRNIRNNRIGKKFGTIVSDECLIKALSNNKNIRRALIEVGLVPKGGNYDRAKKLKALMVERKTQLP